MRTCHVLSAVLSLFLTTEVIAQTGAAKLDAPQKAALPPAAEQALNDKLQTMFKTVCSKDEFSGVFLVAYEGRVISEAACGEASKRYHVANAIGTRFNVASVGKMFTAVAIGQLAKAGRLSYADTLDKYLDASWLATEVTKKITIGQLLSHTSGLGDIFNARFFNSPYIHLTTLRELESYKPYTRDARLEFEPGSNYLYSNMGALLLGVVIEKVSGQNYYDYVREHVFRPAGMDSADNFVRDEGIENLATGYLDRQNGTAARKENTLQIPLRGAPYGAAYSTAHDLLRFARALQAEILLKPATRDLFWQDHTAGHADKGAYGYGFEPGKGGLGKAVGHSGQFPGVYNKFNMYLDAGYTVIVLSNYAPGMPPLARHITTVLEGK